MDLSYLLPGALMYYLIACIVKAKLNSDKDLGATNTSKILFELLWPITLSVSIWIE